MKKILIPILACLALVSCTQGNAKGEIRQLLSQYEKALNTSDAKLAQSLYTEDGVFMPSGAPTATGADAILKAYEQIFSRIQLDVTFSIEEIKAEDDLAFAATTSKGTTLIHTTGQTVPEANRELFVFERSGGKWKIARYMFNKTAPQN